jgi:hypothetical protein
VRDVQSSGKMLRGAKTPKVLAHIKIEPSENDGHVVTHEFENPMSMGERHEPEVHAFGAGDGKAMLAHVAKHLGVETAEEAKQEEEDGDGATE